jgi:P2 family phage contractile tail tube protein
MSSTIYNFESAAVWLDGVSLVGHIKELEMPSVEWEVTEHSTLALRGVSEFPTKAKPMEATITWADFTPDLARAAANPWESVKLQIRSSFGAYTGGSKATDILRNISLSGRFKSNPLGSISDSGEFDRESMLAVDYVKEVWNGQLIFEFGVNPPIYRAGGNIDLLAVLRANLGL